MAISKNAIPVRCIECPWMFSSVRDYMIDNTFKGAYV
jgi:hypothetical protein